ncbi:MAG: amidase, partial [Solirubrobacteraceae bacterium]|nr:amidase [Solirubrobacteraceae bacterium]
MQANDLAYAGAAQQSRMIASGEATAREVVEATLARIDQLNPLINAYRVVFADEALAEADKIDAAGAGDSSQPMRGVPVAIKDDTDVLGERTAWGSLAT